MFTEQNLEIEGHRGLVPHTFLRQEAATEKLAIVFPGYASTVDTPLLYYTTELLLACGFDILLVQYAYRAEAAFRVPLGDEERDWLTADALAAAGAALARRSYRKLTFVGQSLGTLAIASVLGTIPRPEELACVWLAPLIGDAWLYEQLLRQQPRSLFVIGDADRRYDADRLARLAAACQSDPLVIQGAGHDLHIWGDLRTTIRSAERIVTTIARFLSCGHVLHAAGETAP
jgi:pimeloyl-ACP methyl ester carboxylesterase